MAVIGLLLAGCTTTDDIDPVTATFVDPDGTEWVVANAGVRRQRFEGSGCAPATWYDVHGGTPQFWAWFGVPDSGALASSAVRVVWGSDDANQARAIMEAEVRVVVDELELFEVWFVEGEECTHPAYPVDGEDYLCSAMAGPAILRLDGVLPGAPLPAEGEPSGEDPDTGADICGEGSSGA